MRSAYFLLFMTAMLGCSRTSPPRAVLPAGIHNITHNYRVQMAIAKVPDEFLGRFGGSFDTNKGYDFSPSPAGQTEFAAYMLNHTNEFSFASISTVYRLVDLADHPPGSLSPSLAIRLDPGAEELDLARLGMKVTRASAQICLAGEDTLG